MKRFIIATLAVLLKLLAIVIGITLGSALTGYSATLAVLVVAGCIAYLWAEAYGKLGEIVEKDDDDNPPDDDLSPPDGMKFT